MWIKKKYSATTSQLSHSLYNDTSWGVPHAVLISKTNYSNCILNCTVGVCCLHMQQMSVIVPSWNWPGRECCINGGEEQPHRGTEGWSCGRYFSGVLSWQLSQGIPFPAFVTAVVRWELNCGVQFVFNFCPCCGCAPFHALHLVQVLSMWALGMSLYLSRFLQTVWRKESVLVCLLLFYFWWVFYPPDEGVLAQLWPQCGMGGGCGEGGAGSRVDAAGAGHALRVCAGARDKHRLCLSLKRASEAPWYQC